MITSEQWILEVAKQSQLAQITCQQLWGELTALIIGRLTQGQSTYMRSVGLWSVETESAAIALLTTTGERYLTPPRTIPRLTNQPQPLSVEEAGELLARGATQIPQTVQSFYQSITTLFEMHERQGHTLDWAPLGFFSHQIVDGEETASYAFTPSESLLKQVNRPFEMFTPTLLKRGVHWSDLIERPTTSLEEIYPSAISSRVAVVEKTIEPSTPIQSEGQPAPAQACAPPSWHPRHQDQSSATDPGSQSTTPPPLPSAIQVSESQRPMSEGPIVETSPTPPPFVKGQEDELSVMPQKDCHKPWLWILIPLLVLFGTLLLWLFVFNNQCTYSDKDSKPVAIPRAAFPVEKLPVDTITHPDSAQQTSDTTVQANILTTVTIKSGDYLARYARSYLGRAEYWIYIYHVNEERISDPDNIPLGTQIDIPTPQSVGITDDEETSLARAKQLILEYYSHASDIK